MRRFLRPSVTALTFSSICSVAAFAQRPALTTHVPRLVSEGYATRVAAQSASQTLQVTLSLPLRNQEALDALLADLYNPASPRYRQYLTPEQFDAQFGPTAADYATLVGWARANALDIVAKSGNKRILTVQASTSLINRAFHITETTYHDEVRNRDFIAPDREPTTDLAIPLLAISGLDTSNPRVNRLKKAPEDEGTISALAHRDSVGQAPRPMTAFTGSGSGGYYVPSDLRTAYYGVTGASALTGAGQSVAIFSYDGYNVSDLNLWYSHTGVTPSTVPVTNVLTGGYDGSVTSGQDGEQVLDILQVQGMAPGLSHIYFYEGTSAVTELNQMVTDNLAHVVTSSWGGGDFGPATDTYFMQMAAQGTTFLNATGDSGGFNGFTYLPCSLSPWVLQVGGTDLVTGSGQAWSSETAWVDSGGGFYDPSIPIPSWQTASGIITAGNKGSAVYRNSPDIAADADFHSTTASLGAFEQGYGGTSFAAPRLAGYIALANQQSVAAGTGTVGFINPALYEYGQRSTAATTYHDIVSGSSTASSYYNGVKVSYPAVAGYDLATGWGSPNGPGLINALTGPNFALTSPATNYSIARGATSTVNLTLTAINGFSGTPTVNVTGLPSGVSLNSANVSATSVALSLSAAAGAAQTSGTVTVTATSGVITHSVSFVLNLAKRAGYDFTMSATPATAQQTTSGSSTISVNTINNDSPVDLTLGALPAGVTATFNQTYADFVHNSILTFSPGIATAPGTYSVLLTGTIAGGVTHTIPVTFTITGVTSVLADGDFESATNPWVFTSTTANAGYLCSQSCGFFQHGGSNFAYINGFGTTDTDTLSQTVTIPTGSTATLNFWLLIATAETTTTLQNDKITISVVNSGGTSNTLATLSNLNKSNAYALYSYDLSAYLGQTVTVKFTGVENSSKATAFLLDDISLVVK